MNSVDIYELVLWGVDLSTICRAGITLSASTMIVDLLLPQSTSNFWGFSCLRRKETRGMSINYIFIIIKRLYERSSYYIQHSSVALGAVRCLEVKGFLVSRVPSEHWGRWIPSFSFKAVSEVLSVPQLHSGRASCKLRMRGMYLGRG